ncbi:MAG: hypothetical protein NC131_11955 [Roseburia sp.]|nr:hypothetical protein [Roseburia sp.]
MLFYDFEVFKYDWLVVVIDSDTHKESVIINDRDQLEALYAENKFNIWVGFNSRHYDQYILKGILCGFDPKEISDFIIAQHMDGWQFSRELNKVTLNNYDVMPNPPISLKTLEGFLGSDIRETEVAFDLNRKLTQEELDQTVFYCRHDVEETIKIFLEKIDDFHAMYGIVKAFDLPLSCIGDTEARITSKVLGCVKKNFNDEFDYFFLPCIQLKKYVSVIQWFDSFRGKQYTEYQRTQIYSKENKLKIIVAGIPHVFGFGGLHGAPDKPVHKKGLILHIDVGSYYPSMLIGWGLVTRAATNDNYRRVYDTRMSLKAAGKKKEQAPHKKLLNALSGAMKDITNPAYDPRNNNCMCINGQLMLLDLIEHLEAVPGFELIQSNTDGLIIQIPDTDEVFNMVDDICYDWECRCSTEKCNISLGLDTITELYQKDVNNYLWIDSKGKIERKGAYVKELSRIDNDLPILNTALIAYMTKGTPVEQTINECKDLIQFQKVVKLSDKYKWVEYEHGTPEVIHTGVRVIKTYYNYSHTQRFTYKSYRVFASTDLLDGRILKCGGKHGKPEKFANTPDHCFIFNESVEGVETPDRLDRSWYIDLARKRLKDFGVIV